jgi:Holliday junction resolvase-like predicted endonuclease
MSLLAETLVEEWLNRKGYFTIRGIKDSIDEIDVLGVKSSWHCVHCEVRQNHKCSKN